LKDHIKKEWGKRYGSPVDTHAIRKSKAKLEKLAQAIGEDGHYLLAAIYQKDTPAKIQSLFSVEVLRQVWVQQYYLEDGQSYWRQKDDYGFPTSGKMIASPDDLDARYSSKYGVGWTGYKLHVTETCDPEEPRLITQVTTTDATVPDSNMTEAFKEEYKRCAGVEGTIAQAVNVMGARHNRYRGLARTHLQHIATASAINLRRIAAWLMGDRPGATRVSPFAALVAPL
jgi:hypothetical protein